MDPHLLFTRLYAVIDQLPRVLRSWLREWVAGAEHENDILRANGAGEHADARCRVFVTFLERAEAWLNEELSTAETAEEMGRCEETIRRGIREGDLPDRRPGGRGRHRVRRGDALALGYDPAADALGLAAKRGTR